MTYLLHFFSSIRLTVTLLCFSMMLVFFGTLDQVHIGIRGAQKVYFESYFAVWRYPEQFWLSDYLGWLHIPMPGGYLVGGFLFINLLVAQTRYFKRSWAKAGIALIHGGIVLLLVGHFITHLFQQEYQMRINEGEKSHFLESYYDKELVVIDETDQEKDLVVSIPIKRIKKPITFQPAALPFQLKITHFFFNTQFRFTSESPFNQGVGIGTLTLPARENTRSDIRNITSAKVEILTKDNVSLGCWLVADFPDPQFAQQRFMYQQRSFRLVLRAKRLYLPFSIELIDFSHDKYPGTEKARNFSSKIRIHNPATKEDRETLIYMNHPLRYQGKTFYQAHFDNNDTTSIFQVVRNPGRLFPYISCALICIGLAFQFIYRLVWFVNSRRS